LVTNAAAVESTVAALDDAGRLSPIDDALVALVRNLSLAVDESPGNAALWREFRAALQTLSEVGADDLDDDTLAFRVSVQTPRRASVGDSSTT
jgi:hypothetical protein